MKLKVREWTARYLPAELVAILGAMVGGIGTNLLFRQPILTALGGTWGENIGYYGVIVYREVRVRRTRDKRITVKGIMEILRNLVAEFGAAEYLDATIIRPGAMYIFPQLLKNVPLGILLGKLAADVIFYVPTILAYETRKKIFKD